MKLGVLCPSEIAYRRFLPALKKIDGVSFVGVGVNSPEERFGHQLPADLEIKEMLDTENKKAEKMVSDFGGNIFDSYKNIISSPDIDAIYIPLPPALHYKWARYALEQNKHVLVEKPCTTSLSDTSNLIDIAQKNNLSLHENYMFIFHKQLDEIENIVRSGEIGDIRLYRISFGFPKRAANDFRYSKSLGGGALIDAGGYTVKYAARLLGSTAEIKCAQLNYLNEFEVDIFGSATLVNKDGVTAQVAFGMDNDYKCELEIWGSKGTLKNNRVLTAPSNFTPTVSIKKNTDIEERNLSVDDAFKKSIEYFMKCIEKKEAREDNYKNILKQAQLVDQFSQIAKKDWIEFKS